MGQLETAADGYRGVREEVEVKSCVYMSKE